MKHPDVKALPKRRLTAQLSSFNPAAVSTTDPGPLVEAVLADQVVVLGLDGGLIVLLVGP